MTPSQPPITGTTHTLPFDKLSPRDFERLCLWLVKREEYDLDDTRQARYGVYYSQKKPLKLAALKDLPGI
jgi:hypothetical protein